MPDTTIVNTPGNQDSGAAGWVIAVVVLLVVIVGGFMWYRYYGHAAAPGGTTNVNVTLPTPATGGAPAGGGTTY